MGMLGTVGSKEGMEIARCGEELDIFLKRGRDLGQAG
jgi:hypothetical protein